MNLVFILLFILYVDFNKTLLYVYFVWSKIQRSVMFTPASKLDICTRVACELVVSCSVKSFYTVYVVWCFAALQV